MDYKHVLSIIDNESEKFDSVITKTEKAMLSAAVNAIKKLDVDASGKIRTTTANIKLLATIRTKLATVASNKEFMGGVKSVANAMDKLYKAQVDFYSKAFPQKTLGENVKKKHQALQQIAISNVASGLSQSALTASVVEPLNKMLLRAVTSGAKYADLVDEFHKQLESSDDSTSALAKYAKTYATTAMTQLAGENNRLFTDDLGAEWFQYVGSVIETSRQFCELLTEKEYIHKSEIKDILNGYIEIDGKVHECEMNPKTGLPKGLIEGTTEQNFQVNVGGWNCRHQLIPISELMVPEHIRAKFKKDLSVKEKAEIRHAMRTESQVQDIKARWQERKRQNLLVSKTANNVLKVASDFNVDSTLLKNLLTLNDINGIKAETKVLSQQILSIKKWENKLKPLIPDVHKLSKRFSLPELEIVYASIKKTLERWDWDFESFTALEKLRKSLAYEISWMETKGKKYKTWEISRDAYKHKLAEVERRIEMLKVKDSIKNDVDIIKSSKSKIGKKLLSDFETLFKKDTSDLAELNKLAELIASKSKNILARRQNSNTEDTSQFIPKSSEETKQDFINYISSLGKTVKENDIVVDNGFIHLQNTQHFKIYNGNQIETKQEHYQLWNHSVKGSNIRWGRAGYVRTGNSMLINQDFRETKVFGKLNKDAIAKLKAHGMTIDDLKTVKLLDKKISGFSLPIPILVTRYVESSSLGKIFNTTFQSQNISELLKEVGQFASRTRMSRDPGFMSASTNELQNVFYDQYDVKLSIEVPPKTNLYFSDNYIESEVVFGRGTNLEYLSSSIEKTGGYKHLVIRCRMIK
ncbi:MAG: hypothetical protein IKC81_05675 [Paludibacteraceae bacterium]|nr:hypothetical protein [Paludibacteraceae bacterium]